VELTRFEERELKPYAEPVSPEELKTGGLKIRLDRCIARRSGVGSLAARNQDGNPGSEASICESAGENHGGYVLHQG